MPYQPDYDRLAAFAAPRMVTAVRGYIENGRPCDDFLTAMICNDLRGAVLHADQNNLANLRHWVTWFRTEAPGMCWGSREAMDRWQAGAHADRVQL